MPIIKYDFLPDIFFDPKVKKLKTIYRPYVLVKLGNKILKTHTVVKKIQMGDKILGIEIK